MSVTYEAVLDVSEDSVVLGIAVLAARKPSLHGALLAAKAAGHTHVIVDGTLIHTDRISAPGPTPGVDAWWSGKHKHHGGNIQVVSAPDGWPLWTSGVRPGREHDTTAARADPVLLQRIRDWTNDGALRCLGERANSLLKTQDHVQGPASLPGLSLEYRQRRCRRARAPAPRTPPHHVIISEVTTHGDHNVARKGSVSPCMEPPARLSRESPRSPASRPATRRSWAQSLVLPQAPSQWPRSARHSTRLSALWPSLTGARATVIEGRKHPRRGHFLPATLH
jgi:hypothetical protein